MSVVRVSLDTYTGPKGEILPSIKLRLPSSPLGAFMLEPELSIRDAVSVLNDLKRLSPEQGYYKYEFPFRPNQDSFRLKASFSGPIRSQLVNGITQALNLLRP